MNRDKKLFLLDAMALIYRAYFAFSNNPRINSKGLNTSAVFGFTNTLLEILRKEKPTHIAVVFDTAAPTQRHEEFAAYKAHREEMPDDLSKAIPWVVKVIESFNIPVILLDGFEADDLIGTLAKQAEKKGFITYMMTPDKDFGQLVSENIFIYKPARLGNGAEIMGPSEVCKRWDIKRVDQVIDILGLMGDASDNIPGIPGVGEKTAIQLIKDYDSIDNLYNNTDKLKGKLKEKVENNKDLALQSRRLATIICDAPVELDEEKLEVEEPDKEKVKEVFAELEFRTLAQRVLGTDLYAPSTEAAVNKDLFGNPVDGPATLTSTITDGGTIQIVSPNVTETTLQTINEVPHRYFLADSEDKLNELINGLKEQQVFSFDTETTGLDVQQAELVGLSFSWKDHEGWYVPVPEDATKAKALVSRFAPFLGDPGRELVGQNIKYDLAIMQRYGIEIRCRLFDTMIAHYLLRPEKRHNMDALSEEYLKYTPVSIETLIGKKGKAQLSMRSVPLEQIKEYAAEDADVTWQLKNTFEPRLIETETRKLFDEIEIPLVPVLAAMECEGIRVDVPVLQEYSRDLEKLIINVENEINALAENPKFKNAKGEWDKWNLNSPRQVGEVLFEKLRIDEKAKKTKTGQYATGEDILSKLEKKHPIVAKLLDYRELTKLKNTYVDTLPTLVNPLTGRIHTSYSQVVAVTGRLSSDNPNLQNIPIRTDKGREIRKAFIARDNDHVLLSADYSQIELRIMAHMSDDPGMIEAFNSGQDIHAATAAKVYNVPLEEVTSDMRRNAKMVNFGIIYGISAFGLAERLNIPRGEAKSIIENYFQKYSRIKEYMDECIEMARKKGYVETMKGRRRYLRDINESNATVRAFAERNAINAPIQGSAADMIKIAMINIHAALKKSFKTRMLLQVHDELVFDVPKRELEDIKPLIEKFMREALPMKVPVEVGMGTGSNWLEAH